MTTDERIAWVILYDEGRPPEWRAPEGYLVPIRPWWCFWRPRKVLLRMTPENIAHHEALSIPRSEARRLRLAAGHKTGSGYLFSESWF